MSMFQRFIKWLLPKLGLVYISQEDMSKMTDKLIETKSKFMRLQDQNNVLSRENDYLKAHINTVEFKTLEEYERKQRELETRQDVIDHDICEANDYYKEVQSALSKALHDSEVFGFKRSMAFPGSTSVQGGIVTNDDNSKDVVISGRTIFPDDVTQEIQNATSMHDKYLIALNHLIRYGIVEQIAKNIINNGALEFTLAYNKNCTCLELYYQVRCDKPESRFHITVDLK